MAMMDVRRFILVCPVMEFKYPTEPTPEFTTCPNTKTCSTFPPASNSLPASSMISLGKLTAMEKMARLTIMTHRVAFLYR